MDTKEVMLLYCLDILQMVLKWGNFVIYQTLEHAHADQQRPLKLFTHGFRDSTKETETTYFVPGEIVLLLSRVKNTATKVKQFQNHDLEQVFGNK